MISFGSKKSLQAVVAGFGMASMLTMIVALFYIHDFRIDLSPGDRFTLSDHARRILRELDQPIRITAFIRTEDGRNPVIKDLLWQARSESRRITYEVVDINKNPSLATELGVAAYGAVVVQSPTRRRDFVSPNEIQLMSSILNVTRPPKQVTVISGHGECELTDVNRRNGCSQMRTAVLGESYGIESLALSSVGEVARDIDILVINGPRTDFLDPELRAIERYLEEGGKLLVMLDPYRAPRLVALLARYGIIMGENVVLDPQNRLAGGESLSAVINDVNRQHLVSTTLKAPPVFSGMRSVSVRTDGEARQAADLLRTGERSWASHDPAVLDGAVPAFVAGRDLNGPFRVGMELSQPATVTGETQRNPRSVIVAFGDADFATNRFFDYLGNKDLLLNSINWLARDEQLIGARPEAQQAGVNVLFISQSQLGRLFWTNVAAIPGAFLLLGIGMVVWRRLAP